MNRLNQSELLLPGLRSSRKKAVEAKADAKPRRSGKRSRPLQSAERITSPAQLLESLKTFKEFGSESIVEVSRGVTPDGKSIEVPAFVNEFWTSAQRAASRLHEISYRACFKPQLPRFFIERLSEIGERVYDPFMGRGTTLIEAGLAGRVPVGCDINPLSVQLARPRLNPPRYAEVQARLKTIPWDESGEVWDELLVFYHPETLRQLTALKRYLESQRAKGKGVLDAVDDWIAMVAVNRLTGHSAGFFSVYTLPPNQAASIQSQKRINEKRKQVPPRRDVASIILKKSRQLMLDADEAMLRVLGEVGPKAQWVTSAADRTPDIASGSVSLVVTSPPFLDVVQYAADNWLRCWFLGIDADRVEITMARKVEAWQEVMTRVFGELKRVLKPGGWIAFEVGEVDKGRVKLEEVVLACGVEAGLTPHAVMINAQEFTKTANCWGVNNNAGGTNTNRIVLFQK